MEIISIFVELLKSYQQFLVAVAIVWGLPKVIRNGPWYWKRARALFAQFRQQPLAIVTRAITHPERASYLNFVANKYSFIDYRGIHQVERLGVRLPLRDVYVPITIQEGLTSKGGDEGGLSYEIDLTANAKRRQSAQHSVSVFEALNSSSAIILLGAPGSGKSTLLKFIALTFADRTAAEYGFRGKVTIPVLVPASSFGKQLERSPEISFRQFCNQHFSRTYGLPKGTEDFLEESFDQGACLFLIDGLDEVQPEAMRQLAFERIKSFIVLALHSGNLVVLTSRMTGYSSVNLDIGGVTEYSIRPLVGDALAEFFRKFYKALGSHEKGNESHSDAEELIDSISANTSVLELSQTPLLATILALLHRQGIVLPSRRIELYELYVKTLLTSWARVRNLDGHRMDSFDEIEALRILAPLAFEMLNDGHLNGVTFESLVSRLRSIIKDRFRVDDNEADKRASDFVRAILENTGILHEVGHRQYAFIHLTFLEYFACREIIFRSELNSDAIANDITNLAVKTSFHEAIRLAVSYIGIHLADQRVCVRVLEALAGSSPLRNSDDSVIINSPAALAAFCLSDIGYNAIPDDTAESIQKAIDQSLALKMHPKARYECGKALDVFSVMGKADISSLQQDQLQRIPSGSIRVGSEPEEISALLEIVEAVPLQADLEWVRDYWRMVLRSEGPSYEADVGAFSLARFPVTNLQYATFLLENPDRQLPAFRRGRLVGADTNFGVESIWRSRKPPAKLSNAPVVFVSWEDANAYCAWLSQKWQRNVRLPTEIEREYAARGGLRKLYPLGDSWSDQCGFSSENQVPGLPAVGLIGHSMNAFGLSDLSGLVWEWTSTRWGDAFDGQKGSAYQNIEDWRVVRGSAWDDPSFFARCASRGPNPPESATHYIGFRIAVD